MHQHSPLPTSPIAPLIGQAQVMHTPEMCWFAEAKSHNHYYQSDKAGEL